jgi:hypothetical protein
MELQNVVRIGAQKELFLKNFYKPQIPCVFTDFTKNWGLRNWDVDYLKSVAGEDMVKLFTNAYESGQTLETYIKPQAEIKFSDYLDIMNSNADYDLRLFLFDIFKDHPDLVQQIKNPDIGLNLLKYRFSFFGTKNSATRMHYDIDYSNVFLSQFMGRKRVLLFDRNQAFNLYQIPYTTHSLVDFSKIYLPEYSDKFPNLYNLKGYEVILEPGETLFMPSGYWHYISYEDSSFSVALRSLPNKFNYRIALANNVFFIRNLNKIFDLSPFLKKMYDDMKLNALKRRYSDHSIKL